MSSLEEFYKPIMENLEGFDPDNELDKIVSETNEKINIFKKLLSDLNDTIDTEVSKVRNKLRPEVKKVIKIMEQF